MTRVQAAGRQSQARRAQLEPGPMTWLGAAKQQSKRGACNLFTPKGYHHLLDCLAAKVVGPAKLELKARVRVEPGPRLATGYLNSRAYDWLEQAIQKLQPTRGLRARRPDL
jgi:hypothetical protein